MWSSPLPTLIRLKRVSGDNEDFQDETLRQASEKIKKSTKPILGPLRKQSLQQRQSLQQKRGPRKRPVPQEKPLGSQTPPPVSKTSRKPAYQSIPTAIHLGFDR